MSTIIQIKRNSGTSAPTTSDLVVGELAYAYDAAGDGAGAKLFIEGVNSSSAAVIHTIGGKYYTDLMDHTLGTVTASSALLVDSNKKLNELLVDNVTIDGNDVSTTDSNGNLTLTPNGTGSVVINKNDGFRLPVGNTSQRLASPTSGQIRYNSEIAAFEGYAASSWGTLGGVIDVDQDTKITAESAAGEDEDVLTFFTAGTAQIILADGALKPVTDSDIDLGTSSLEFKDAYFDGTVTTDALVADSATLGATTFGDNDITNVGNIQLDSISGDADTDTSITFSGSDVITVTTGAETQVTFNNGSIVPTTDDDVDLGTSSLEFKNLYLDGTANIDSLVADTADINGGTIDGVVIGGASVATQINVDNLRFDGNAITSTDSNGDITISPNGTGNVSIGSDSLLIESAASETATVGIYAGEAAAALLVLSADDGDDNGDDWTVTAGTDNTLAFGNDISGSLVSQIVLTPHATVASSTTAIVGALTVAGVTTFSGAVDMGSQATTNVNIDSGAIDAVTIGTNSAVTDLRVDNLKLDGNDISSTDSNGNVSLTPNGTGNVVVNSDSIEVIGTEGETASLFLKADESDDASDDWSITAGTDGVLSFNNDIASAGTQVAMVTMTPHATVASSTLAALGNVTISGNLTVNGTTTTAASTNTVITDKLIELANGASGSASGDVGLVLERGSEANVFIGWDESINALVVGTGTFTGSTTGDLSHTLAAAKFGSLTLTTDLAVADGGTGVSSFTDKGIVYGDGSNALDVTAAPGGADATTSFQILTCGSSNGNPVWSTSIDGGTY
jgi:hypothetical protein